MGYTLSWLKGKKKEFAFLLQQTELVSLDIPK